MLNPWNRIRIGVRHSSRQTGQMFPSLLPNKHLRQIIWKFLIKVDVSREKSTDECQKDITIQFVIPGESSAREETFKCSKNNFGVFKMDLTAYSNPNPATEGRWVYRLDIC